MNEFDRSLDFSPLERQWKLLADVKLAEWKRKNWKDFPTCPEHIFLDTEIRKVKARTWLRELWLFCPGAGVRRGF